jgi:hypothetical protein
VCRPEKLLWLVPLFAFTHSHSQPDSSNIIQSLSAKFGYSSIWTGRGSLQQYTNDHPWSVQLDWGITKNTEHSWNYCNCYSENGVSLGYINFANPQQLGRALTFSVFAQPYLVFRERFQLSLRGSAGLAFLNKVYDSVANKDAIFFSTNRSYALALGLNAHWQLSAHWKVNATAQFNHISNGGRKDPNEGMNFPGAVLGISYLFNAQSLERRKKEPFTEKPFLLVVHGFGGVRTAWADANWPDEQRVVVGTNVGIIKRLGRIIGIGAGGEYYYDGINAVYQQRTGQNLQTSVAGVSIQNYIFYGKLLFGQQFAWYVTSNTGYQKNIYQRYLLEYEVKRNWYAGVSLKAHGDHSDYMAVSVGYFFKI